MILPPVSPPVRADEALAASHDGRERQARGTGIGSRHGVALREGASFPASRHSIPHNYSSV